MAYEHVNDQWPGDIDRRALSGPEAISAAKRLYRFAMKKPYRGKFKLTSGRRYSWPRRGVFFVNPEKHHFGPWRDLVHDLSHYCAWRLHPGAKPHGTQHHFLEKEMVAYVIRSGWLEGKLLKPTKEKPPVNKKAERAARVLARIETWERKKRRAETALRKLKRQASYYAKAA